jgi:hypothetical protein
MTDRTRKGNKSFVLITSLLAASVLMVITVPYVSRVTTEYKLMQKVYSSTAALDLAEAGIERVLWERNWNSDAFTGYAKTVNGDGSTTYTRSVNSFQTNGGQTIGDYDISATICADGSTATVTGTGYVPNRTQTDGKRVIKVVYAKHNFPNAFTAVGNTAGAITLGTQNKVDSYNSANGTYSATHQDSNGNISTNGSIVLGNQARVYGDARPGASYPFPSKPSGVYGAWGTLAAPAALDPVPRSFLDGLKNGANNNGNIIKGETTDPEPLNPGTLAFSLGTQKTATLPGGTYHFTSLTIGTQSTLNVTGPTTIYVDSGNIYIGTQANLNIAAGSNNTAIFLDGGNMTVDGQGNVNNLSQRPRNMVVYSTGSNINLTTQTDFYGAIYAPSANVTITTHGEVFGSVSSRTINCGTQASLHFDADLLGVSPVFESNGVTSWQDIT